MIFLADSASSYVSQCGRFRLRHARHGLRIDVADRGSWLELHSAPDIAAAVAICRRRAARAPDFHSTTAA